MGWAFENEGGNDICSMTTSKTQENTVNTMLRSVEPSKSKKIAHFVGLGVGNTQHMQCFARLSLRKHNSATLIFPSKSQRTVNAVLCWDGPLQT